MHLSDETLLAPTADDKKHLLTCSQCRERYDNALMLKSRLSQYECSEIQVPEFWDEIERACKGDIKKTYKVPLQLSVAASLLLGLTTLFLYPVDSSLYREINASSSAQLELTEVAYDEVLVNSALASIDRQLKVQYEASAKDSDKLALWKKRNQILKSVTQNNTLSI